MRTRTRLRLAIALSALTGAIALPASPAFPAGAAFAGPSVVGPTAVETAAAPSPLAAAPLAADAGTPPVDLDGVVTDRAGVLGDDAGRIQQETQRLAQDTGTTLYVVVVDRFADPADGFDWSTEVARRNGLSDRDVVLYVATASGEHGLNASTALPVPPERLVAIAAAVDAELDAGDRGAAALDAVRLLRTELTASAAPGPTAAPPPVRLRDATASAPVASDPAPAIAAVVGAVLLVVAGGAVVVARRRGHGRGRGHDRGRGRRADLAEAASERRAGS